MEMIAYLALDSRCAPRPMMKIPRKLPFGAGVRGTPARKTDDSACVPAGFMYASPPFLDSNSYLIGYQKSFFVCRYVKIFHFDRDLHNLVFFF